MIMFGQQAAQTFPKKIDFGREEEIIQSIELSDESTVHVSTFGFRGGPFNFSTQSLLFKLSKSGSFLDSIVIDNLYPFELKGFNDTLAVLGFANEFNPTSARIFLLDSTLNVFDTLIVSDSFRNIIPGGQFVKHKDGGFTLSASFLDDASNQTTSKILRFDDKHQLLREEAYDTSGSISNISGGGIIQDFQRDVLYLHQVGERDSSSLFLFDDSLNLVDSANFVLPDSNQLLNMQLSITNLKFGSVFPNGNFVVSGTVDNPINISNFFEKAVDVGIIVFDSSLNKLNSMVIGAIDTGDTPGIKSIYVGKNHFYHINTKAWSNFNSYGVNSTFTRLMKFDFNGNLVYERLYSHSAKTRLNSIIKTQKGDFLLSGYTYDSLNFNSQGMNAYIMKIDSSGSLITGIEAKKLNLTSTDFLIYPNPASTLINLKKVNFFETYRFRLFTIDGKEVLHYEWVNDQAEITLEGLPNGVYLFSILSENRGVFSGKIVKQ